jgi:hypothetical protein
MFIEIGRRLKTAVYFFDKQDIPPAPPMAGRRDDHA